MWYQEERFVSAYGFGGFQAKGAMLQKNTLDDITCREHVRVECEVEPVGQLLFTTICSQSAQEALIPSKGIAPLVQLPLTRSCLLHTYIPQL